MSEADSDTGRHFKQGESCVPRHRDCTEDSKEFGGTGATVGVGRQGAGRGLGDDAEFESDSRGFG